MTTSVHDDPEHSRYEITVDGEPAGLVAYRREGDVLVLTHTEVPERFAGQGLAGELVAHALDDARARGLSVVPECPYVRRYLGSHPEALDLVRPEDRERYGL